MRRAALWVLALGVAAAFAVWVWPTPWVYYRSGGEEYRRSRFTQVIQRYSDLMPGWYTPDPEALKAAMLEDLERARLIAAGDALLAAQKDRR